MSDKFHSLLLQDKLFCESYMGSVLAFTASIKLLPQFMESTFLAELFSQSFYVCVSRTYGKDYL